MDEVPASVQSAHGELEKNSAYRFYSSSHIGGLYSRDPSFHGIAPTTSVLDLRDPSTALAYPFTTSAVGLGLMNVRSDPNGLVQHPDKRFGFPHLAYPTNHYGLTPYDGVYAVGTNNVDVNNNPKPDNQWHVEDVQGPVADYLSPVEIAPEDLFLSNQTVGGSASASSAYTNTYVAELEARNSIRVGNSHDGTNSLYQLMPSPWYLTSAGDFKVALNTKGILHAGQEVSFHPGTEIAQGAELAAFIEFYPHNACNTNVLNRIRKPAIAVQATGSKNHKPEILGEISDLNLKIYPNPACNELTIQSGGGLKERSASIFTIGGVLVKRFQFEESNRVQLELGAIEDGMYLLCVEGAYHKLIVNR